MLTSPPGCTITALPIFVIKALPSLKHCQAVCSIHTHLCLRKARQPAHRTPQPLNTARLRSTAGQRHRVAARAIALIQNTDFPSKAQGPSTHTLGGPPATTSRRKVIHPPGRPLQIVGRSSPAQPQNRRTHTKQLNTQKIMIRPDALQASRADNTAMYLQCHCVVCEVCRHAASLQVLC